MKKMYITFLLFYLVLSSLSQNIMLSKVDVDYSGYNVLDFFYVQMKIDSEQDYSRSAVLTRYKFAILIADIIRKLDVSTKYPEERIESLEYVLDDFIYEIKFLYGDSAPNNFHNIIKEYRKEKGLITHRYVDKTPKKELFKEKERNAIYNEFENKDLNEGALSFYYKYTSGYDTDIFRNNTSDKDYVTYFKTNIGMDYKNTKFKSNITFTDDNYIFNGDLFTKVLWMNRNISYFNYSHNDNKSLSYNGYYYFSEKDFDLGEIDLKYFSYKLKRENNKINNYFYGGYRKDFTSYSLYSHQGNVNAGVVFENTDKDYELTNFYNNNIQTLKVFVKKDITGKFIDGMEFDIEYYSTEYTENTDRRMNNNTDGFNISLDLPFKNTSYSININNYSRDVILEDINYFDADFKEYSISRYWFQHYRTDLFAGYRSQVYDAMDNVSDGLNADVNDYSKKYFNIGIIHYFDLSSFIDINFHFGNKEFNRDLLGYENYDFVLRSMDLHIKDYIIQYSTLHRRYHTFTQKNSKLFNIGVFYAYYW